MGPPLIQRQFTDIVWLPDRRNEITKINGTGKYLMRIRVLA
jgi:hypothetical protein